MIVAEISYFKQTILYFRTKFAQTGFIQSKTKKCKHYHCVLHTGISLGTKSQIRTDIISILDQIYSKKVLWVKNGKSKPHLLILHI